MSARVDEALRVVEALGCRLLPCGAGTKKARLKDWPNKASTDPAQIEKWFGGRSQSNPAVVAGFESGFFILDVDPKHGGAETLAAWVEKHGPLPETLTLKTPSGGRHLYFRWPNGGGIGNRGHVDAGIDIRGEGGYALIPPAVMADGTLYEWANWGTPLADAPQWLLVLIRRHPQTKAPPPGPAPLQPHGWGDKDREERVAKAALDSICSEIVNAANGEQDNTLNGGAYRIGRWVQRGHLPESYASERLIHAGLTMTSHDPADPWTPLVIVRKVTRAMADGRSAGPADLAPRDLPAVIEGGSKRPRGAKTPEGEVAPDLRVVARKHDWRREFPYKFGEKGVDPKDPQNVRLELEHWPEMQGRYTYDSWSDTLIINRPWPEDERTNYPRPVEDADLFTLMAHLWRQGLKPPQGVVEIALVEVARRCWAINPLIDYLTKLAWDGEDRLDGWLANYMGVPASPEATLFGRKFLIGAAARATRPRCKNDTMLTLQGPQGQKKSTAWRTLFGETYFSDNLGDVRDKDALMGLAGMWGIEWAEMSGLSRVSAEDMKAFLSRQEDRFRPPYGRSVIMRPRRCVFVGSTNQRSYLRDPSGGRRYWPVTCVHTIDLAAIERDRNLLWAEAMHRLEVGETWWLEGPAEEEIAKVAQEGVYDADPWEGPIIEKLAEQMPGAWVPTHEILWLWLGVERSKQTTTHSQRLGGIMDRLGIRGDRAYHHGRRMRGYIFGAPPPDE
jgi:predicted P-loop ATPase